MTMKERLIMVESHVVATSNSPDTSHQKLTMDMVDRELALLMAETIRRDKDEFLAETRKTSY